MSKKDIIFEELKKLEKDGRIYPEEVVEVARDENSPLHNRFEWEDTKAAQEYRLWQARQLITAKIQVEGRQTQEYFNVKITQDDVKLQGYFTKEKIMSDREMYLQVLKDAIDEIEYWQKKYESIKELDGVVNKDKIATLHQFIQI